MVNRHKDGVYFFGMVFACPFTTGVQGFGSPALGKEKI
jgi:hypothetical protein